MAKEWPEGLLPVHHVKPRKRRSSEVRVRLATIVAMVSGLGIMASLGNQPSEESHPLYTSKEECEREWSDHDCEPTSGGSSGSGGGHGGVSYRGPAVRGYTVDENGKAHRTDVESDRVPTNSRAIRVQRGGFGSTGGRFGAHS
jgi:hypothetical protein